MKTSDDIFEELGYKLYTETVKCRNETHFIIKYVREDTEWHTTTIQFDAIDKTVNAYCKVGTTVEEEVEYSHAITLHELKAIIKKYGEEGWL